jgi:phosphoribosylaminoimidazole-succinocarboxamide synthase
MPEMPDSFVHEISARYIELYETITGLTFERNDTADLATKRIFDNVSWVFEIH